MTLIDLDASRVREMERILSNPTDREHAQWLVAARIEQYEVETIADCRRYLGLLREPNGAELRGFCAPDSVFVERDNILTSQGIARMLCATFALSSYTTIDGTTRGRIGVGDGNTAVAAADTDLSATPGSSSHRQFQRFDSAPTRSGSVVTCTATFGTSVAQFNWLEWGIDGGTLSSTTVQPDGASTPGLFNHKLFTTGPGTKGAASWVFAPTFTLS